MESNQFRELTHLSLNLHKGTDATIRSYLSSRLHQTMAEFYGLVRCISQVVTFVFDNYYEEVGICALVCNSITHHIANLPAFCQPELFQRLCRVAIRCFMGHRVKWLNDELLKKKGHKCQKDKEVAKLKKLTHSEVLVQKALELMCI